jgi:hypothetical protein
VHAVHLLCCGVKLPNLELKTWPKQLSGSLLLDIAPPISSKMIWSKFNLTWLDKNLNLIKLNDGLAGLQVLFPEINLNTVRFRHINRSQLYFGLYSAILPPTNFS